jgi:hypothetical protein
VNALPDSAPMSAPRDADANRGSDLHDRRGGEAPDNTADRGEIAANSDQIDPGCFSGRSRLDRDAASCLTPGEDEPTQFAAGECLRGTACAPAPVSGACRCAKGGGGQAPPSAVPDWTFVDPFS